MNGHVVLDKNHNALQKTIWALILICAIIVFGLYQVVHLDNADIYVISIKVIIILIASMMFIATVMGIALWRLRKAMQGSKTFKNVIPDPTCYVSVSLLFGKITENGEK